MSRIFDNTEKAFVLKKDSDLERAYFLFKLIAKEPLVKIGTAVTNFALKAHLPVEGLVRATVFDHFCGGVSEEDCLPLVDRMYEHGVSAVLDYSVEGKEDEAQFDAAMDKKLKLIDFAANKDAISFAVMKPTALGRFALWQKVTEKKKLSSEEQKEWERVQERFDIICKRASEQDVYLLIDGEETWMQDAADDLVEEMMRRYNKQKAYIFNTVQCYRWDRMDYVKQLHEKAKSSGFRAGLKIVRGAYMEKEADRAEELGYKNPICESKQATDDNFDAVMTYIMNNLTDLSLFVGSHNEDSNYLALQLMQELNIDISDDRVWFGQLMGMSDHLTFNLAAEKYNAIKLVPFGPVRDVMPYLIRRAQENTSVAGQTTRELDLLKKERARRKI